MTTGTFYLAFLGATELRALKVIAFRLSHEVDVFVSLFGTSRTISYLYYFYSDFNAQGFGYCFYLALFGGSVGTGEDQPTIANVVLSVGIHFISFLCN